MGEENREDIYCHRSLSFILQPLLISMKKKLLIIVSLAIVALVAVKLMYVSSYESEQINRCNDSSDVCNSIHYLSLSDKNNPIICENVSFADSALLPYLLARKQKDTLFVSFPIAKNEWTRDLIIKDQVSPDLLRIFANIHVVNGWYDGLDDSYQMAEETMIEHKIQDSKLFYCGQLKTIGRFSSFLLLLEKKNSEHLRDELYLVNMFEDTITSVSKLFHILNFPSTGLSDYSFTVMEKDNTYQTYYVDLAEDLINGYMEERSVLCRFSFEEKGHVDFINVPQ